MRKTVFTLIVCFFVLSLDAQNIDTLQINIEGVSIYSVLTKPQNNENAPLAIFIAGSGPTDLDGNQVTLKNNSLKLLSDELVAQDIATLRFDKRGIAHSYYPGFSENGLTIERYANDVIEIINQMETKGFKDIFIVGHSEGSLIGLIALQQKKVKAFISIAGAGFPADEILKTQLKPQLPPNFYPLVTNIIDSLKNKFEVKNPPSQLYALFRPSVQPYLISWFSYSPTELISKLDFPVLIIQGEKDIQVSVEDAKQLSDAAKKDKLVIVKNMNHIFKTIEGDVQDNYASYNTPELPVNKELSKEIINFIHSKSK